MLGLADARPPTPSSSSPAAWPSATATSWPRPCPEVDAVAGFGVPVTLGRKPGCAPALPSFDLLNLPRPPAAAPWAYVKVAEGCDKACGFCAIPSFRGPQRSRSIEQILAEVDELVAGGAQEIVLVAQDLASYGRDQGVGTKSIVPLVEAVSARVPWVRLLYLYPSDLTPRLVDAVLATGVPYFDLSLQHVSAPLVRRMRRWGDGDRFLDAHRRHPGAGARRRVPVQLHRRLPGRDRGRPRPAARLRRRRPARLVRVLRLLAGGRHLRRRPRRRGAASARGRAAGRAARAPGRHHRGPT